MPADTRTSFSRAGDSHPSIQCLTVTYFADIVYIYTYKSA